MIIEDASGLLTRHTVANPWGDDRVLFGGQGDVYREPSDADRHPCDADDDGYGHVDGPR